MWPVAGLPGQRPWLGGPAAHRSREPAVSSGAIPRRTPPAACWPPWPCSMPAAGITRGLTEEDGHGPGDPRLCGRAWKRRSSTMARASWPSSQQVEQAGRELPGCLCGPGAAGDRCTTCATAEQLVAIYPREGTLWEDHPLALLEHPDRTAEAAPGLQPVQAVSCSRRRRSSASCTQGYRPTDLTIPLDQPESPISAANGVDPTRPYTTLQIPSASVVVGGAERLAVHQAPHQHLPGGRCLGQHGGDQAGRMPRRRSSTFLDQIAGRPGARRADRLLPSTCTRRCALGARSAQGRQRLAGEPSMSWPRGATPRLLDGVDLALDQAAGSGRHRNASTPSW